MRLQRVACGLFVALALLASEALAEEGARPASAATSPAAGSSRPPLPVAGGQGKPVRGVRRKHMRVIRDRRGVVKKRIVVKSTTTRRPHKRAAKATRAARVR